jgi:hypothetical protein
MYVSILEFAGKSQKEVTVLDLRAKQQLQLYKIF